MGNIQNEWHARREALLFRTAVRDFPTACHSMRECYRKEFPAAGAERKTEIIEILREISIDMQSYLLRWQLQDPSAADQLSWEEARRQAEQNYALLAFWGQGERVESVKSSVAALSASNLLKLSRMADTGAINNRWGHDAATGLTWAVRRGAVLVTTNPIMVNALRKQDPAFWDRIRDELKQLHPESSSAERASLMTMRVVLMSCRELRPLYEASQGEYGYVSLQINPRANRDPTRMAEEVESLYAQLARELNGTPNTVFKIPGTQAGLDAARRLTAQGIGCTVTVNCSVDQNRAFAEVIEQGRARVSFLVVMSGRLDDLVRAELEKLGEPNAAEAWKWAGVAVIRRSYEMLYRKRRYRKSRLLTASLRGPWHIDGSITDGEIPIFITCFPEQACEYDTGARKIASHIDAPVPGEIMSSLTKSRIFRQAYEVGGLAAEGFDAFPPVVATIDAFTKSYDELVQYNQ